MCEASASESVSGDCTSTLAQVSSLALGGIATNGDAAGAALHTAIGPRKNAAGASAGIVAFCATTISTDATV